MGRHRIVALGVAKTERQVRLHGVEPAILERVGAHLVDQADPPTLLPHVEDHAPLQLGDLLQRHLELVATVAAKRAHHVAREAFAVQARGQVLGAEDVAVDEGDVLLGVPIVPERDDAKPAEPAG